MVTNGWELLNLTDLVLSVHLLLITDKFGAINMAEHVWKSVHFEDHGKVF